MSGERENFHNPIHWRMQSQRYQLTGARYPDGQVCLVGREKSLREIYGDEPRASSTIYEASNNGAQAAD
ncbi:hypothetical protein C4564_04470 [Candidatus Microgenomates bacterium]|nr:MAG: hypothetical protein C4564_04470 [Candidatus Microgenomates bacterium]